MQPLNLTDSPPDSPLRGYVRYGRELYQRTFDALRRAANDLSSSAHRTAQANSLVRFRQARISVGIDVGEIGLERLEPGDVGA